MFLPLPGNSRITVKKGCNEVCLVPIDVSGGLFPRIVPKEGLGYFWVDLRRERLPQHRRNDRQVKKLQPSPESR